MNLIAGKLIRNDGLWFDDGTLKLKLSLRHADKLGNYVNKEVVFGIRPEDIHLADSPHSVEKRAEARLTVEVVEPMGNETFLHATTGSASLTVRQRAGTSIRPGQQIELVFNLEKVRFYQREGDETLFPSI